jgi:hypothetical protein
METFLKPGERELKARAEDERAAHERQPQELRAKGRRVGAGVGCAKRAEALNGKPEIAFYRLLMSQSAMRADGKAGVDRAALPVLRHAARGLLQPAGDDPVSTVLDAAVVEGP